MKSFVCLSPIREVGGSFARDPAGKGLRQQPAFAAGGREGAFDPAWEGERGGSSASSQRRSVHSSYIYPHGRQLYLSGMPQEPKVFGVISALRQNAIWVSFLL